LKASPRRLLRRKPAVVVGFSTQDHLLHWHYLDKIIIHDHRVLSYVCYTEIYRKIIISR
jgi:hypothetical protein